jgi:hypothetical protein
VLGPWALPVGTERQVTAVITKLSHLGLTSGKVGVTALEQGTCGNSGTASSPGVATRITKQGRARSQWLTPVIPATQEAEIRRIMV